MKRSSIDDMQNITGWSKRQELKPKTALLQRLPRQRVCQLRKVNKMVNKDYADVVEELLELEDKLKALNEKVDKLLKPSPPLKPGYVPECEHEWTTIDNPYSGLRQYIGCRFCGKVKPGTLGGGVEEPMGPKEAENLAYTDIFGNKETPLSKEIYDYWCGIPPMARALTTLSRIAAKIAEEKITQARKEGYEQGKKEGYDEGRWQVFKNVHHNAYEPGFKKGYEQAVKEIKERFKKTFLSQSVFTDQIEQALFPQEKQ